MCSSRSTKERARGEPEPPFEVGDEDDPFPGSRGGLNLARGTPAFDAIGDPPGSPQPSDFGSGYLRSFLSDALALFDVVVRGVPRHDDSKLQKQGLPKLVRCKDVPRQLEVDGPK